MSHHPLAGTRAVLLAAAVAMVAVLMLALAVWAPARPSSLTQPIVASGPSAPAGGGALAAGSGEPAGNAQAPAPSSSADQLHSMDPKSLDRYAAGEDAPAGSAPAQARPAKGTWLLGEVGTYVVGRGASPGTYVSAGAGEGKVCQWGVSGGKGTTPRSGSGRGRIVVTIHKADRYFATQNCSNWQKVS